MNWTVLIFDKDRHQALQNSLCRRGVICVIPKVQRYNEKAKKNVLEPAFNRWLFVQASERQVHMALSDIMYIKDVWRDPSGKWCQLPDPDFQAFLDRLEKRHKKAEKAPKGFNMADATALDWFNVTVAKFGLQVAIKQFGYDLRKEAEAA